MPETTYPKFFESDGEIFRVSDVKGFLVAEIFDKASSTFKRVYNSATVLWEGKEIPESALPDEIKKIPI